MNNPQVRWRLSQGDLGHLSMALKPIRTQEEVAKILGLSATLVCQLENSALRKIVRAITRLDWEMSSDKARHQIRRTPPASFLAAVSGS